MSLYGAFDSTKHLDELNSPLATQEGFLTPSERRAATIANLLGSDGDISDPGITGAAVFNTSVQSPKWLTGTSVGTVGDVTVVAEEHGDGVRHFTKLTLTAFPVGTGGDTEDLAIGAKIYTFPAGTIVTGLASIKGIFDQASHGTITDGECGLGTVIGSTAVDTLGEVGATSENIIQGDVGVLSTYVLGTTVVQCADYGGVSGGPFTILSAGVHDVFLNLAATWPNIAAPEAVTFTGVICIEWALVS